jgi:carbon monoxide dehydrogenase subunit G
VRPKLPTRRLACSLFVLVLATGAAAFAPGPVALRDIPGSDGEWQEGSAIVPAPPERVVHWLTAYREWTRLFPDVEWAQVLPRDRRGRDVVRFRSRYAGRAITMHQAVTPNLLTYDGYGANIHTQGRVYVIDLGNNRSRVIMQTTSEVHGMAGVFASRKLKRTRAFQALRGHLSALIEAARASR